MSRRRPTCFATVAYVSRLSYRGWQADREGDAMGEPVVLKRLLAERHWSPYSVFSRHYDKAARSVDPKLVGTGPSRAQLHRWLNGDLKGFPHPNNCQVLEAMFPDTPVSELFEPLSVAAQQPTDVGSLVADALDAPVEQLGGWRSDQLSASSRTAPFVPGQAGKLAAQGPPGTTKQKLAKAVLLHGKRLRLTDAEITELAKLAGHLVDLELDVTIDIDNAGVSEITYRFHMLNLTDKPIKRMAREQWFENTDGRLCIEPHASSDRDVHIQRTHDTANMSKFACVFNPPIAPGEVGTVAYTTRGGQFLHDHYWRQSTPRYTRRITLTIRHCQVATLFNCTAVVDEHDGNQISALDDLVCLTEDGDALMTLTRDYLQPNDAVTIRWQVAREGA